jgi:hypothetical protein
MNDRVSRFQVARLSLYPPAKPGGHYRYALIATTIRGGIPSGQILVDGLVRDGHPSPTTEEILMAMDAALRQSML